MQQAHDAAAALPLLLLNSALQHSAAETQSPDLEALAAGGVLELIVLWEAARQAAPDAVRVQLQRLAQLLHLPPGTRAYGGLAAAARLALRHAPCSACACRCAADRVHAGACSAAACAPAAATQRPRRAARAPSAPLTSSHARWMMAAPVLVTTPAISMEYQRAPLRMT